MTEQNRQESAELKKPDGKPAHGKKRRAVAVIAIIALAATGLGSMLLVKAKTRITTDNAFVDGRVFPISARVPGHVARVLVDDNQFVRKGDLLLELDPADYRTRIRNATALLDMAKNETTSDYAQVDAARAALESDQARLEQAELDLERGRTLYKKEVIPKEQLDRLETARKIASSRLVETEGALRRAKAVVGLTGSGSKEARIAQRQAECEQAGLNLAYTRIYAPADGYITRKSVEPGNNIQPGQALMALVSLDDAWITANYKESQLTHVQPGQKVEFCVDTYPGQKFRGTVDSIMAGTGAAFSLLPPENATGNYVKVVQRIPVKIRLEAAENRQHPLRVGMSVEPTILTGRGFFEVIRELNPF